MKTLYFVTEGITDRIVLEGLLAHWLDGQDYLPVAIQPPASAYAEGLGTPLSQGWRGVLRWCGGARPAGPFGRAFAVERADCLVIHTDADVATDRQFADPAFSGTCPPARDGCDWVRRHLTVLFEGGVLPENVVLCVPSRALEAWVVSALHADVADEYAPIECRDQPEDLLVQRPPHRVVSSGKKQTARYREALAQIVKGWPNCAHGEPPRCPEAARFEAEARRVLRSP